MIHTLSTGGVINIIPVLIHIRCRFHLHSLSIHRWHQPPHNGKSGGGSGASVFTHQHHTISWWSSLLRVMGGAHYSPPPQWPMTRVESTFHYVEMPSPQASSPGFVHTLQVVILCTGFPTLAKVRLPSSKLFSCTNHSLSFLWNVVSNQRCISPACCRLNCRCH